MNNQTTINKLIEMRLTAMADAYCNQIHVNARLFLTEKEVEVGGGDADIFKVIDTFQPLLRT